MAAIHDIRFEQLARTAPQSLLPWSASDISYLQQNLSSIGDSFGLRALPYLPLQSMNGQALARHLAQLRSRLCPQTPDQDLALGRLESVFRLVASAIQVMRYIHRDVM